MDRSYISILKSWHWLFHVNNIAASKSSIPRNPYRTLELSTWGWSLGGRTVLPQLCSKVLSLAEAGGTQMSTHLRQSWLCAARQA